MTKTKGFYGFEAVSSKAWKHQIQAGLKGGDYNDLLVWDSLDQIKVKPFYHSEDLSKLPKLNINHPDTWAIGQFIYVQNEKAANKKALESLRQGTESLIFKLPTADVDLDILLAGIEIEKYPIHFILQFSSTNFTKKLSDFNFPKQASVFIHLDVINHLAATGNWYMSMEKDLLAFTDLVKTQSTFATLSINGSLYQNAGANRIQQLAYMLGQAHEYLHIIQDQDTTNYQIVPCFNVAINSDYFFEIAKIRALRLLWKTLAQEYGAPEHCHIIAQPSKRNKSVYAYNTNLLRTTTECMAAILGGADTLVNLPYDALYHKENDFGDRMARNQLLILRHESYFDAVSNPADGAYYIESLTHQLAEKALQLFKSIEASGGFLKALKSHSIQKKIREQAEKEQNLFDEGQLNMIGSNVYSDKDEAMKQAIEIYPFLKSRPGKTLIEPILEKRLAESLEQKRLEHE